MKKIHSTKDIRANSILRIYKRGFGYSKATIIEVNDYYIAALIDRDLIDNTDEGDKFESYLWLEDEASYEFVLEIIGMLRRDLSIIFFKHTDEIISSKNRKCLKASVQIPLKFFPLEVGSSDRSFDSRKIEFLHGTIVELSDREALLQFSGDLRENQLLRGHLPIDDTVINVIGRIHSCRMHNGEKYYDIVFEGMNDKERNRILDYVFDVYRE